MKIKKEIITSPVFVSGLRKLANTPMGFKPAYQLALTIRAVESELALFQQARSALIRKYGDPVPNTNDFAVTPESKGAEQFTREMVAYLSEELEVPLAEPITIDLAKMPQEFTPLEVQAILAFIFLAE